MLGSDFTGHYDTCPKSSEIDSIYKPAGSAHLNDHLDGCAADDLPPRTLVFGPNDDQILPPFENGNLMALHPKGNPLGKNPTGSKNSLGT